MLKMEMKNFKGASSAGKVRTPSERGEAAPGKQIPNSPRAASNQPMVIDDGGVNAGASSPTQGNKKPRRNSPIRDQARGNAEEEARKLEEEVDARMRELGILPFMNDLAACKRVGDGGLDLFHRAYSKYPAQLSRALKGKIASTKFETRRFANRLEMVQDELDSQRAYRYTHLSSENRELKAQVDRLQSVQFELNKVNHEIAEKNRQLEDLPKTKAEAERAQKTERTLRKESAKLKASIEKLREEKVAADEREKKAGTEGFQQAFDLTVFLAPWVNFGNHVAKDDQIWLNGQVVLNGEDYRKSLLEAAAEEDKSPGEQLDESKAEGEASTGEA